MVVSMTTGWPALRFEQIEECGKNHVHHDYAENRGDHRGRRRTAHAFRATTDGEALVTTDLDDHHPENDAFDEAGYDVAHHQGVSRGHQILAQAHAHGAIRECRAAQYAHCISDGGEARHHHHH